MNVRHLHTAGAAAPGLPGRRSNYHPDYSSLARGRVSMARAATGMSPSAFATALSGLVGRNIQAGHITNWESSATPPGDVLMAITALAPTSASTLGIRSHKFIAAYVGHAHAASLQRGMKKTSGHLGRVPSWTAPIDGVGDQCSMVVFPFGTVIVHLLEEIETPDVASLAFWRYESYVENLDWASQYLSAATGDDIQPAYVLSAYWVHAAPWAGANLDAGLRLICSPRVLVGHDHAETTAATAQHAEQELLSGGYHPPEMKGFGAPGISSAWASWSGVVYHPHDPLRALPEPELVQFEIGVQAMWAYTGYITDQIEHGVDLNVHPDYGYRFLRSMRMLLLTAKPRETVQQKQMRDAIVTSSGLPAQLDLAMEALKEVGA